MPNREVFGVVTIVIIVVSDEEGLSEPGEKLQVAPDGRPVQLRFTDAAKPFSGLMETFVCPVLPVAMVIAFCASESVKSGVDGGADGGCTMIARGADVEGLSLASPL